MHLIIFMEKNTENKPSIRHKRHNKNVPTKHGIQSYKYK